jgi:hypothetical protein
MYLYIITVIATQFNNVSIYVKEFTAQLVPIPEQLIIFPFWLTTIVFCGTQRLSVKKRLKELMSLNPYPIHLSLVIETSLSILC